MCPFILNIPVCHGFITSHVQVFRLSVLSVLSVCFTCKCFMMVMYLPPDCPSPPETDVRLTFSHQEDDALSAGFPSYVMQEEFSRFVGFWWAPTVEGERGEGERLGRGGGLGRPADSVSWLEKHVIVCFLWGWLNGAALDVLYILLIAGEGKWATSVTGVLIFEIADFDVSPSLLPVLRGWRRSWGHNYVTSDIYVIPILETAVCCSLFYCSAALLFRLWSFLCAKVTIYIPCFFPLPATPSWCNHTAPCNLLQFSGATPVCHYLATACPSTRPLVGVITWLPPAPVPVPSSVSLPGYRLPQYPSPRRCHYLATACPSTRPLVGVTTWLPPAPVPVPSSVSQPGYRLPQYPSPRRCHYLATACPSTRPLVGVTAWLPPAPVPVPSSVSLPGYRLPQYPSPRRCHYLATACPSTRPLVGVTTWLPPAPVPVPSSVSLPGYRLPQYPSPRRCHNLATACPSTRPLVGVTTWLPPAPVPVPSSVSQPGYRLPQYPSPRRCHNLATACPSTRPSSVSLPGYRLPQYPSPRRCHNLATACPSTRPSSVSLPGYRLPQYPSPRRLLIAAVHADQFRATLTTAD